MNAPHLANSSDFMREFEVSRRTVARDLDYLRDEENAPLAYDEVRHGYVLTDETYALPPVNISRKEAFSFGLARKLLAHYEGLNLPIISSGAPDQFQEGTLTGMVEIGRSLPLGVHTLSVYFVATDINFPLGGPIPKRLPTNGSYSATIRVSPGAPDLIACDSAKEQAYADGWQHGDNGGLLVLTNHASLPVEFYQVGISTNTP